MTEIVHEIWRPVPGYEGFYEVSSLGRIKSLARQDSRGNRLPERIRKPWRDADGYQGVAFWRDGRQVNQKVHRLVCEAFHGPAPAGKPHALHGNHDPSDNRAENLRWGDHAENMQDMVDADRQAKLKGEAHGKAKITEADVKAIQDELLSGAAQKELAVKYGLRQPTVSDIANGKKWAHIANPELQAKLARKKRPKTLSDKEVLEAFELTAQGLPQREVASRLGVGQSTIGRVLRGRAARHRALRSQWLASRPAE